MGLRVQAFKGVEAERERPELPCANCRHWVFVVISRGVRSYGRQDFPDLELCVTCNHKRHVWG